MFFDDHKKLMTVMRAKRSEDGKRALDPTPMKPEASKEEDGSMDGKHAAMQDFLSAHAEKSPQKMSDAMSNFLAIHNAPAEPSESSES